MAVIDKNPVARTPENMLLQAAAILQAQAELLRLGNKGCSPARLRDAINIIESVLTKGA